MVPDVEPLAESARLPAEIGDVEVTAITADWVLAEYVIVNISGLASEIPDVVLFALYLL